MDDLDETIKIIRSTIFGLRSRETAPQHGLRTRAVPRRRRGRHPPRLRPRPAHGGPLDTHGCPARRADDAVAVLGEAPDERGPCTRAPGRGRRRRQRRPGPGPDRRRRRGSACRPAPGAAAGLRNLAERAERARRCAVRWRRGGGAGRCWCGGFRWRAARR
ncbi:hypothetical protein [Streptomyces thioluteus]|uniref:hypothetical protein n=1 Tax=Streptomyces thioluteus TaxID=66431 RepID=UPI0031F0E22F